MITPMTTTFVLWVIFAASPSEALEVVASGKAHESGAKAGLPLCVNDPERLQAIEESLKKDPVTKRNKPQKYNATIEALSTASDAELVARLTYAETRAAHCPEFQDDVAAAISQVIQNRIAKRQGKAPSPTRSVVFEIDQFASSLNKYEESQWREFLCPSDAKLWAKALEFSNPNTPRSEGASRHGVSASVHNYYLYKHAGRFTPPKWAQGEAATFVNSEKIASCIKLFEIPYK